MIFRFREFPVYKNAREYRKRLKEFSKIRLPIEERFVLRDQLWRALDSIILNIAEGWQKYSDIEFSKYLNNSLASLSEVVACLDAMLDDEYVSKKEHEEWLKDSASLHKQLSAFSAKVRKDAKRR